MNITQVKITIRGRDRAYIMRGLDINGTVHMIASAATRAPLTRIAAARNWDVVKGWSK